MTTIATDGRSMSGDTMTTGNTITHITKLFTIGDYIYGISGCASLCNLEYLTRWVKADYDLSMIKDNRILRIRNKPLLPKEIIIYDGEAVAPFIETYPLMAIGSGCTYAIGAMENGATPRQAVGIAMKHDCCTGGTIHSHPKI